MGILNLNNVSIIYNTRDKKIYAVKNVSLSLEKGDALGIVGESGSGKSTLAMGILRLLPESTEIHGDIIYKDKNLPKLTGKEMNGLRWKDISVVFQKSMNSLSPVHRIGKQFEDIYRVHKPKATVQEIKNKTISIFKMVNLPERIYNLYPHELSGGMMQRVSIALALLNDPELLIMDESTTALDVITQGQILEEIKGIQEKLDVTRIMITHDLTVVASSCNKIVILYAGEVMEEGETETVMKNPKHPYTVGLMESIPDIEAKEKRMISIPGNLPDLSKTYEGCIYYSRCPKKMDICLKNKPLRTETGDGAAVYCHLYQEVKDGK